MEPEQAARIQKYQLAEPIGKGRNGTIYQALDTSRQQLVALKLFGRFGEERPEFVWKYLPALEDARVLEHDNIVAVRDVQEHEGILIIASEFVEGRPLDERLQDEPMSAAGFLDLATQMARAIGYAHDNHTTHGNIKHTNILVGRDGHVTMVDFGLPRWRNDICECPVDLGVDQLVYLSPRLLDGETPSQSDDLYALGVVYYFMLTTKFPFAHHDEKVLVEKIRAGQADYALLRQLGVHGDVVLLIERLLGNEMSGTCRSAEELLVTLESIAGFEKNYEDKPAPQQRIPTRAYLLVPVLVILLLILWSILASYR
jgi:serine/threonine-protein kinase